MKYISNKIRAEPNIAAFCEHNIDYIFESKSHTKFIIFHEQFRYT